MQREYNARVMVTGMSEEGDQPRPSLRESEVSPPRKTLAEILEALPTAPGVYIMKDARGKQIYIGKAAVLRNRVRQYFQPASGDSRDFVPLLEGIVADIETVVTSNEKEALLLENTLIKRHQPRFNVKLTDDKNFLVLRLDPDGEWPRLEVTRRLGDDGAYYFGPYHSATSCREALRVVNRHFQLRTCTDHVLHNRKRPCLQYQIKRCPAPCVLPVSREAYGDQVRDVRLFLDGKNDELLDRLRARMKDAAARTEFEVAAEIRDQIRALEVSLEEQRVVSSDFLDQDVVGFHREGIALEIVVMSIRNGQLNGSRAYLVHRAGVPRRRADLVVHRSLLRPRGAAARRGAAADRDRRRRAQGRVAQREAGGAAGTTQEGRGPDAAAGRPAPADRSGHQERGGQLRHPPQRPGRRRAGARQAAAAPQADEAAARDRVLRRLPPAGVRHRRLDGRLRRRPPREEPLPHLQGAGPGRRWPQPPQRRLRLDVRGALAAVPARAREDGEDAGTWKLPDLIVVDGGKGQLAMALAAARDVGIDVRAGVGLPIVALAKERDVALAEGLAEGVVADAPEASATPAVAAPRPPPRRGRARAGRRGRGCRRPRVDLPRGRSADGRSEGAGRAQEGRARHGSTTKPDRVFLPHAKDAIPIRTNSAEMFVLQQLRDEAHRFAISFHRNSRRRLTLRSALSDIPGIGPGRQRQLLRHFGSVKRVREATVDELAAAPGISPALAEAIHAYWAKQPLEAPAVDAHASSEELAIDDAFSSGGGAVVEMTTEAKDRAP